jgi:hypothetical protein
MATYKRVDADQLDADLTTVADAIRTKGGTSEKIAFPDGFVSAVTPLVNAEDYLAAVHNKEVSEIINHKMTGEIPAAWQMQNRKLTKIDFPLITTVQCDAFRDCSALSDVNLPAVTRISASVFEGSKGLTSLYMPSLVNIIDWGYTFNNSNLAKAYFPKLTTITGGSFNSCQKLTTLILGADTVCSLESTNAFQTTPIAGYTYLTNGEMGYIYVPAALVNSYKVATNWARFESQIRAIEDYPEVLEGWE